MPYLARSFVVPLVSALAVALLMPAAGHAVTPPSLALTPLTDYNGDGYADVAIGVPLEDATDTGDDELGPDDPRRVEDAGAVNIIYGASGGLGTNTQIWTQDTIWSDTLISPPDRAEVDDRFGWAVASGDFNNDTFVDLAVGAPWENSKEGAVSIIYGSPLGLTPANTQFLTMDSTPDFAVQGDEFGSSLAAGDLNGDGFDDLAVGAPFDDVSNLPYAPVDSAGSVSTFLGSALGLGSGAHWTQNSSGIIDAAEESDQFGYAVAIANLGNSASMDLAIGVPGEWVGGNAMAGAVNVLYSGSSSGNQLWHQDSTDIAGVAESFDQFGAALAAGNFGNSSHADLAVGVPAEEVNTVQTAGMVNVIYGSSSGLAAAGNQAWHQDSTGIGDSSEMFDSFGQALAAGDFGDSSHADLAVGVPNESVGTIASAGAVTVIYGSSAGLTDAGDQLWNQDSSGIAGSAEDGDDFGYALWAGNFGNGSQSDLAIGVPLEEPLNQQDLDAGMINAIYGASGGLIATGNAAFSQNSAGVGGQVEPGDTFGWSLG